MKTSDARLAINRRWRQRNRVYLREYHRAWRAAHPEKVKAHRAVKRALKAGKLTRPEVCQCCGEPPAPGTKIQAHHARGYHHPLMVVWVCVECHAAEHPDRH